MNLQRLLLPVLLSVVGVGILSAQVAKSAFPAVIDRYALTLSVDESHHRTEGMLHVGFHVIQDSVTHLQFVLGSPSEVTSVRDLLDKKIDSRAEDLPARVRKTYSLFFPDTLKRGDSIALKISYETTFDTASTLPSFINEGEILLSPNDSISWWPLFPGSTLSPSASISLEVVLSSAFTVVSPGIPDTSINQNSKLTWRSPAEHLKNLSTGFLFCASKDLVRDIVTPDSGVQIIFSYPPGRCNRELAGSIVRQLADAYSFFSTLTGFRPAVSVIPAALVGTDDGRVDWFSRNGAIIGRNSYGYSVSDTSILSSARFNKWVHELSHLFGIASTDSTYWFDEGWANYLTTKYFLKSAGSDEDSRRRVRLDLFSTTLDFYPSQTLAQGRLAGKNEEAVFFKKGACAFLMLEFILGEDAFRTVTKKLYTEHLSRPISIKEMQQLCELAYGSSLDWFFEEWIQGSGFPEFILSTEVVQTPRGSYAVKAKVSQRGGMFTTPLSLMFTGNSRSIVKRVFVAKQDQVFEFILPFLPARSELDPDYDILRWVPTLRLLAHARSAVSYRVYDRDLANSEREAMLTLQLDPANLTGWNNIALYSLGKSAVIKGELAKGEEYFRRTSALGANEPTQLYSVLSLVRLGNVLEMEGKREEALELYKLCATLAERNPVLYNVALFEARKYLRETFVSTDEFWYGEY